MSFNNDIIIINNQNGGKDIDEEKNISKLNEKEMETLKINDRRNKEKKIEMQGIEKKFNKCCENCCFI